MYLSLITGVLGLLAPAALGAPSTFIQERQDCTFDSKLNPSCWKGKFNLQTSYYEETPEGKECPYTFELKNITMAPDGVPRTVIAVNGQIPGPTIECEWGDTVGELRHCGSK